MHILARAALNIITVQMMHQRAMVWGPLQSSVPMTRSQFVHTNSVVTVCTCNKQAMEHISRGSGELL